MVSYNRILFLSAPLGTPLQFLYQFRTEIDSLQIWTKSLTIYCTQVYYRSKDRGYKFKAIKRIITNRARIKSQFVSTIEENSRMNGKILMNFALTICFFCCCSSGRVIESPHYNVIHVEAEFEIRQYKQVSWISALVQGTASFEKSTQQGFHRYKLLFSVWLPRKFHQENSTKKMWWDFPSDLN